MKRSNKTIGDYMGILILLMWLSGAMFLTYQGVTWVLNTKLSKTL